MTLNKKAKISLHGTAGILGKMLEQKNKDHE